MQMLMPEPQIYVERTLALIKPDVIDKEEEIEEIILRSGFTIVQVIVPAWRKVQCVVSVDVKCQKRSDLK